jgi:PAS domain-containing protein
MENRMALLSKEFEGRWKNTALTNIELTKKQRQTIFEMEEELKSLKEHLEGRNKKLRSLELEVERLKNEILKLKDDLVTRNKIIEELKGQLAEKQTLLLEKINTIGRLESEKEYLKFAFDNIKNSVPSSIITIDKDNVIIDCNTRAEEELGLKLGEHFEQIKNETICDAAFKSQKDKKPITLKSVSIKGRNGTLLTNVSSIPLMNNEGEFHGALMIINNLPSNDSNEEEDLVKLDL